MQEYLNVVSSACAGAFALMLGVAVMSSSANAAPELKVGYVDMQKALASTDAGKEAQKKYEAEVKKLQAKLDDKKGDFEKLQGSYQKQKDSLSEKARAEKEEELMSHEKELKRTFQDSQEMLRRKNAQLVGELLEKMRKVVDTFGKAEGYTLILERGGQGLLFADSSIDVTDSIVKRFNSEAK